MFNVEGVDISVFCPSKWFQSPGNDCILLSVYKVPAMGAGDFNAAPIVLEFDISQVRASFVYCKFVYPDIRAAIPTFRTPNSFRLDNPEIIDRKAPEAAYLVLSSPLKIEGADKNESQVRQAMALALSLILAVHGRSAAFSHVFDHLLKVSETGFILNGGSHMNYWFFGKPNLDTRHLDEIKEAEKALLSKPSQEKNRISLSLRWFSMATYDSGIDAFLKYWIALETLAMPDDTNIKPLREILAKASSIETQKIDDSFGIGRIYGLRSDIVHKGLQVTLDIPFLFYMSRLYSDVLFEVLGLPRMNRAQACLADPKVEGLKALLTKAGIIRNKDMSIS
jgi:hypothetical protein